MSFLALQLSRIPEVGHNVIDRTGLKGDYRFNFDWSSTPNPDMSVFTAVTEQLGLALKPTKAPIDFLVIDPNRASIGKLTSPGGIARFPSHPPGGHHSSANLWPDEWGSQKSGNALIHTVSSLLSTVCPSHTYPRNTHSQSSRASPCSSKATDGVVGFLSIST